MAKNDTTLIYNEAKVSEGKDLLAGIRKAFIDVDNYVYDGINKISTAKGIENVTSADYSIDLKKPTNLVDQSRSDLKRIIDTLDEQIRLLDKFMNSQEENTTNTPINNDKENTNIEDANKDETYTKNQLLGIEEIPKDEEFKEEITEKVTGTDPTTDATKNVKIDMPNKNEPTVNNPTVIEPQADEVIKKPTDNPVINNTPVINDTTITNPVNNTPVENVTTMPEPPASETIYKVDDGVKIIHDNNDYVAPSPAPAPVPVTPAPAPNNNVVQPSPVQENVNTSTNTNTNTNTTTTPTTPKTETTTKVSTPKVSSNINSKNASVVPSNTNRDTQTENRVKTDTKKESYTATRHDGVDKKVIAGAIGGAALLGAVGIGVAASATKKKEKDTDESFEGSSYTPSTDNYNPN